MAATNGANGVNGNSDKQDLDGAMVGRKINSRKRANIFSKLFFLWMMPLFKKGLKKDLTNVDICQPMNSDKSEPLADGLEQNWFLEISRAKLEGKRPSLLKALVKTYTSSYIFDGLLIFIVTILCRPFQPMMLAYLVDYFSVGSETTVEMAYVYAASLVGLTFFAVFIQNHTILRQQQLGMRIRVAACSLVYRKVLRLNSDSLGKTTAGQLVNLMSNDVSRFDQVLIFLHYLWTLPIQVALICYLIYTRVSVAALIGVASITLQTVPVQSYMSKLSSNLRKIIAVRTDERVRLMSEVISGIQVIKMYAWEKPFEKMVSMARAHELSAITKSSYLRGIYMSFMVFTERASLYVTLLAYTLLGNKVTSGTVFSLAQFYNTLQGGLAIIYPTAISSVAECLVTIRRLEDFLILDERDDLKANAIVEKHINGQYTPTKDGNGLFNPAFDDKPEDYQGDENYAVNIKGVTARWVSDGMKTLDDFSVAIPKGKLCAIIGSVGSGKSSILQLLLKELTPSRGSVEMKGALSYASQEPWLFVATVRNNILFGLPYDHKRYREVVRVCALEKDFQQFPRGDQTLVGERGVSLSGGQRARINLARAVYREKVITFAALLALASASEAKKQEKRGLSSLGYGGQSFGDHSFGGESSDYHSHSSPQVITKTVHVPQPYPVHVERKVPVAVKIPVDRPYPVHVDKPYAVTVDKPVHYKVYKNIPYPVKVPYKVPVIQRVEVKVPKPYPVPVDRPYPVKVNKPYIVEKKVPVYIDAGSSHGSGQSYGGYSHGASSDYSGSGHDFSAYNQGSDYSSQDFSGHGISSGYSGHSY